MLLYHTCFGIAKLWSIQKQNYNFLKLYIMYRTNYLPGLLREYCMRSSHSSISSCSLQKAMACSMSPSSSVIKTSASFVFPIRPVNTCYFSPIFNPSFHIYIIFNTVLLPTPLGLRC